MPGVKSVFCRPSGLQWSVLSCHQNYFAHIGNWTQLWVGVVIRCQRRNVCSVELSELSVWRCWQLSFLCAQYRELQDESDQTTDTEPAMAQEAEHLKVIFGWCMTDLQSFCCFKYLNRSGMIDVWICCMTFEFSIFQIHFLNPLFLANEESSTLWLADNWYGAGHIGAVQRAFFESFFYCWHKGFHCITDCKIHIRSLAETVK